MTFQPCLTKPLMTFQAPDAICWMPFQTRDQSPLRSPATTLKMPWITLKAPRMIWMTLEKELRAYLVMVDPKLRHRARTAPVSRWEATKCPHGAQVQAVEATAAQASGQARGNSGVYVQSRYEVQVLDSFALEGENNECGGIYKVARPSVKMCLPPLSWQTYDVSFTAAKFDKAGKKLAPAVTTIRHNGVVIHDKLTLKLTAGGGRNDEKPGALYLQNHGDPVRFRNIWVVETK